MKILSWLCCLWLGYSSCTRLPNRATLSNYNNYYGVNASLNDSTWFGNAHAYNDDFVKVNKSCPSKRFLLSFETDIPLKKGFRDSTIVITGCMGKCTPTQLLSFPSIPLAVGRYSLSSLKKCLSKTQKEANYLLLDGGDVASADFYGVDGWIEVIKYSASSQEIEGSFEVTLASPKGEVVRFRQGIFRARLGGS